MGQVLIRNLDDRVIETLKLKAEIKGRSLEQELREMVTAAAPLTSDEKVALFERIRLKSPVLKDFDISAAIRSGRDDGQ